MSSASTRVVKANGISFHCLETGQGPLVLCLHGFPDNAHSYRHLMPELADAGFRVVAPFMRGYAPTEAPADGRYQAALLARDVLGLIDALGAESARLVGHDWGARAVYGAAVLAPGKVTSLVTIASAHPGAADSTSYHYLKGMWHAFYFQLSSSEQALAHDDYAFIEEWWRDASPGWDIQEDVILSVKETFRTPGVVQAALGYYRHSFNPDLHDPSLKEDQDLVSSGPVSVPTLALHGDSDRPGRLLAFLGMDRFFTGGLEKVVVPHTGHFMHLERPDLVNPSIVRFLTRPGA
jgi:pimeloyl-ACP methyl ester carboxylesterase